MLFFELGRPSTLEMFYVIFALMLVLTLLLNLLSKEHQKKLFHEYHLLEHKRHQYDWDQIVNIRKKVFLTCLIYSGIIILLTHIFGLIVSNIGIFIGAFIFIMGLSYGEPKKNKRHSISGK